MYLEKINGSADVKALSIAQMEVLAGEIRQVLLEKLSKRGGHFGPNFGMVEATIALHYVFDSPRDKFVFDVSHQSYCHKILTGRKEAFMEEERYNDVSGYSNPKESVHDFFTIGHTSTSVSLACGLAKGRDLKREQGNVIAVIGDGSLSGGEALEGLDFASELNSNLIIVVNDNEMSIAENHGGLYGNLKDLRESGGTCACNFFKAMGLDYFYVEGGNDIAQLIEAFKTVKDSARPVVVHIHTQKGKGYGLAERNMENWHWCMPFVPETGEPVCRVTEEDYGEITYRFLAQQFKADDRVVAVTSGTPAVMGFGKERRQLAGAQFVDVGIAEECAVALCSGIAKSGGKPVYGVYSTFMQRTYDQIAQDVCVNKSPVTFVVFSASIYGMKDVTHLGIYDIPMISNIPELVYLAPSTKEEYLSMLEWSIHQQEYPVAIRVPGGAVVSDSKSGTADYSKLNRYQVQQEGSRVAIIALGTFNRLGAELGKAYEAKYKVAPTLINPLYITGLDRELLESLKACHNTVVTIEDGVLDGGFGEKIARFYGDSDMKVLNYGYKKEFLDRYDIGDVLRDNGMTVEQMIARL